MKKKLLSIALSICMVVSLLPNVSFTAHAAAASWSYPAATPSTPFQSGDGSSGSPYVIATAQQLANLAYLVNNAVAGYCESGVYYKLSADIELNDWTDDGDGIVEDGELSNSGGSAVLWVPIGDSTNSFTGTLSGNGCTISGIYISGSDKYQGLFGYISDGAVTNINVENSYISSLSYIGGITGYCINGTITNCKNIGCTIISSVPINSGYSFAGGIVGYMYTGSSLTDCSSTGSVSGKSVNATAFVGGIAGSNYQGTVTNCHNSGSIYGQCSNYPAKVGGVAGYSSGGTVIACSNAGSISGIGSPSNISIGGLVGEMSGGTLADSNNTGDVSGEGGYHAYVGGVSGKSDRTIYSNCYNRASITGEATNNTYVGGVSGYHSNSGRLNNCYNTGSLSGVANTYGAYVGGILGYLSSATMNNCYNTGSLSGTGATASYVGATCGYLFNGTISSCYWLFSAAQTVNAVDRTAKYELGVYRYNYTDYVAGTDDYTSNFSNSGVTHCYSFSGSGIAWALSNSPYSVTTASGGDAVSLSENSPLLDALNTWVDTTDYYTWKSDNASSPMNGGFPLLDAVYAPVTGTLTITVTNGYGGSADQIKIGATLTATANTTPDTNLSYQWQVSANGSDGWASATGSGNNTAEYTVPASDVTKYLRVAVTSTDAPGTVYSAASAQVPYTITLSQSGNTGADAVSFSDTASAATTYAASGSVSIYYTLDSSGTGSNTLTYSGGSITQVTSSGTGSSSYSVSSENASGGVIAITAAFSHINLISGTPTFTVSNGYGDSSDQIKIGATLTATANTTPDTNLSYQWQVSANGSDGWTSATGTGNNTAVYTVASSDVTKYLRVAVTSTDAPGTVYSVASAQVPYTITLSKSGNAGTDKVSFRDSSSVATTYAASGSVPIYYTLDSSGTGSNTLTYSGGSITQVTSSGTGSSSYTVSSENASSGVIAITAAFSHINLISGTPTITVTNGYGGSSDQIKIGATLTATANTTPSTHLSYQWQVSANGSDGWTSATGSGNNTAEYSVASSDVTKYLRVAVTSTDATGSVYSAASAQVPYTITLSQSGNTGTDKVSFSDSSSVSTTYAASGSVSIYYTLDDSGTGSNTLTYSGGSITQVTSSGTGSSSYSVSSENASSGVVAITAAFSHINLISGTPTITVTNGYGDSSDQIKIGATLTATANTTPSTHLSYQWQVSANGSDGWTSATGSGNNTEVYTVDSSDVTKYLRIAVTSTDAPGTVYSAASAQVPYTITLSQSGNTGADAVSFSDSSSVATTYAANGNVPIYYTLDSSGTGANTITYSGGTITQVTSSGTRSSSYTVSSENASSGVIAITAAFSHINLISGTPTITVTNGYGGSSDQIKIGATLTATANTTPSTHLSYQWQVSANGSDGWTSATGSGNNTEVYTVASSDVTKYLRVAVTSTDAPGTVYSAASAQVPYTITLSKSGNAGTDKVSFRDSSSVATTYAASGNIPIYYTLDSSGTGTNTITYSGGTISQVTSSGTGSSSYTVSSENASSGVVAITAAFSHINLISGTPTITVTNGYGGSSDQIKIGATLTATANTTPSTHLSYQWQVSANGSDGWTSATGSGNNTAEYSVASSDVTKYLRIAVTSTDAPGTVCSAASAQVPYTITLSHSENTGTDKVSFSDSSSVSTTYAASGSVSIYYTLDSSGTKSNTLTYSGGTITQVATSGTSSSSYPVSSGDASDGLIAITATFNHTKSSSSRGSSSSSTTTTPSSGAPVIVNGQSQTAGTSKTTTENGQTQTTITVDTDKLEDILDSAGDEATVIIPITDDSDSASGVLTGQMVKRMEEKESIIKVQTGSATYTLPAEEIDIDKVSDQFGEDIDLSDITVEVTISEPDESTVSVAQNKAEEGGFSLVVQPVEFTVSCTHDGETVAVTSYHAYVERTIEVPDGVDPNQITTAVVVESDGTVRHVPTQIIEVDGVYFAIINSLTNSVYTLIHNSVTFTDVTGHWAQDAIHNLGSRMVINGDQNGNFRPEGSITRAEFSAIIIRALGLAPGSGTSSFHDVSASSWYCGYVETAAEYGIINGYADGTFGANDLITREQAMTIIARAMQITKLDDGLSENDSNTLLENYIDAVNVSDYARKSAAACIETGIISGKGNKTLAPKDNMTRAEVAVIMQRLLQESDLI